MASAWFALIHAFNAALQKLLDAVQQFVVKQLLVPEELFGHPRDLPCYGNFGRMYQYLVLEARHGKKY